MTTIIIHPELQHFLLPLSTDERIQLIANLQAEGCRDALVVWEEENAILDGHNRLDICETYELPYRIEKVSLPNLEAAKAWILRHQLGRRNLTGEQASYLRGKERQLVGVQNGETITSIKSKVGNSFLPKTDEQLARKYQVTDRTIRNDAAYARSIDTIAAVAPEAKHAILARDTQLDRKDVKVLAGIAEESPQSAKHILAAVVQAPTRKEKKQVLREAVKARPKLPKMARKVKQQRGHSDDATTSAPLAAQTFALTPDTPPKSGLEEMLSRDSREKRPMFILHKPDSRPVFNRTNEMVDWAVWTWNPVTGCWHDCNYCLSPQTTVLMADRTWRNMADLSVGDLVIGVREPGHHHPAVFQPTPVTQITTRPQVLHELITEGPTLYCSEHHPWLTIDTHTKSLSYKCWHDLVPDVDIIAGIDPDHLVGTSVLPDIQCGYRVKALSCTNASVPLLDIATGTENFIAEGLISHNCYAREIAHDERMAEAYPKQFEPTFHPARLDAPANTSVPKVLTRPADKNVFTCSMADLFGKWVPDTWILQVFERVTLHQEWNFLFLTKFPQRLAQVSKLLGGFPSNAWMGCTVDGQARVATAERAFQQFDATVKWLSVEPMNERLTFHALDTFDWLVMGGQSASNFNGTPAKQPEWEWVEHLWQQARAAQIKIYWKENLTIRPKEMPWDKTGQPETRQRKTKQ